MPVQAVGAASARAPGESALVDIFIRGISPNILRVPPGFESGARKPMAVASDAVPDSMIQEWLYG